MIKQRMILLFELALAFVVATVFYRFIIYRPDTARPIEAPIPPATAPAQEVKEQEPSSSPIVSVAPVPHPALDKVGPEITAGNILQLTNQYRAQFGISALKYNTELANAAQMKADDMASKGYFDHVSPDGYNLDHWIDAAGYPGKPRGENLAQGYNTVQELMQAWQNSLLHALNMDAPSYQFMGVGIAKGSYKGQSVTFVVVEFGG